MKTRYKDLFKHCAPSYDCCCTTFLTLLTLLIFSSAQASPLTCEEIFHNGLQSNGPYGFFRFAYNSQLINPSSDTISASTVVTHASSGRKSCGEAHCYASGSTGPYINADPLKTTTSTNMVVVPPRVKQTVGQTINEFSTVNISEEGVAEFSGAHDEYIIDTLTMSHKSTLRLSAGSYWIRTLKLEVGGKIEVLGEGTVTLFVQSPLTLPYKFRINDGIKNPAKFALYSYSDVEFYVGSQAYAFIHVQNRATLHYTAAIAGGLIANEVDLLAQSQVRYDALAARELNFGNLCGSLN